MKIYNLADTDILDSNIDDANHEGFRITDIKQAIKNENRVNIFVNDKYAFSLDIAQVVDFKLKIGLLITEEQLAEYKKAGEFGKAYQRALEWVLMRPRSERELRDYLKRRTFKDEANLKKKEWEIEREIADLVAKGEDPSRLQKRKAHYAKKPRYDFADLIVERLVQRGYVDDEKFAKYYVENRFEKKGISRKRLKLELMNKGVSDEIIEKVLNGRNDEEEILKMIAKKRNKYDDEKLINYLVRQGFSYQQVQSLVLDYGKD